MVGGRFMPVSHLGLLVAAEGASKTRTEDVFMMRSKTDQFTRALILCTLITGGAAKVSQSDRYSWQEPHATVLETGDLQWAPEPFVYEHGEEVRYIDYENGDDQDDGKTKEAPWKHHPWDMRAGGNAAEASGPITYVFKGGVDYRIFEEPNAEGQINPDLRADESGEPGNPIRLTSDPSWGEGEAVILGSVRIPSQWVKATENDVPARMDHTNVWYLEDEPNWWPRHPGWPGPGRVREPIVFEIHDGEIHPLHLARDPDWAKPATSFAWHEWHRWDGTTDDENEYGYDEDLKGFPQDYFEGGTIWSQNCWFMGVPTPYLLEGDRYVYDPETGALDIGKSICRNTRYMIEDLPQYLDAPGEFWADENRRLYMRPYGNRDPNSSRYEFGAMSKAIHIENQSNIAISGLTFRFSLTGSQTIEVRGGCKNISIENCFFDHVRNRAIEISSGIDSTVVMDSIRVADNEFRELWGTALSIAGRRHGFEEGQEIKPWIEAGALGHVQVLRNKTYNTGLREGRSGNSNVPAIGVGYPRTAEIAGNIVNRSIGSGIVVHGGKSGGDDHGWVVPLTRILVHHNKIENTTMGVNDYGGLALWQGGSIYSYNNISGNSLGHWPGGLSKNHDMNLGYAYYIDGGYKIYTFNNITWGRTTNPEDVYRNKTSGYFMVFGFLNPVINNTFYRADKGIGGSSGNRTDVVGNVFAEIKSKYLGNNRMGDPSLVGGGDDGSSGIRGIPTLAYTNNIFQGEAIAGSITQEVDSGVVGGARIQLTADDIDNMSYLMQKYPIRKGSLGWEQSNQIIRKPLAEPADIDIGVSAGDFRLKDNSLANNMGAKYFIPWALSSTVGEWHFNRNNHDPSKVLDYHWFMDETHFARKTYEQLPYWTIDLSDSTLDAYVPSASEDWIEGAVVFNGSRYGSVSDADLNEDLRFRIWSLGWVKEYPKSHWVYPEPENGYNEKGKPLFGENQYMEFPAEHRRNLEIDTTCVLLEAVFRVDNLVPNQRAGIAGKFDGTAGYRLVVNPSGTAEFEVASGGSVYGVPTAGLVNDGLWHHVIGELSRRDGTMRIYLDGTLSAEVSGQLGVNASLSNDADFLVGRTHEETGYFHGALDFLRVCQSTLAESRTTIEELYEWQTNGPVKYDFAGNAPIGRRDAGALENADILHEAPMLVMGWDFAEEGDTAWSIADVYGEKISREQPSGVITMGDGLKPTSWAWDGGFTFTQYDSASLAGAILAKDYIEFTVVTDPGEEITLTAINMNTMGQGETSKFALFSDRTDYSEGNEIETGTLTRDANITVSLDGFAPVSGSVTFRMYFYGTGGKLCGIQGKDGLDLLIESTGIPPLKTKTPGTHHGRPDNGSGVFERAVRSGVEAGTGQ